jgi:hypothetical protein
MCVGVDHASTRLHMQSTVQNKVQRCSRIEPHLIHTSGLRPWDYGEMSVERVALSCDWTYACNEEGEMIDVNVREPLLSNAPKSGRDMFAVKQAVHSVHKNMDKKKIRAFFAAPHPKPEEVEFQSVSQSVS